MPANFVYTLPDDLRFEKHIKHISCITGIFHIFDQQPSIISRKQRSGLRARLNPSDKILNPNDEESSFSLQEDDDQVVTASGRYSLDHLPKTRGGRSNGNPKGRFRSPSLTNDRKRSVDQYGYRDFDTEEPPQVSFYKQDQPRIWHGGRDGHRNSPSILDSSKSTATFREPPRNSLDSLDLRGALAPYFINDKRRASTDGRDARRSPSKLRDNSHHLINPFDPPRASLDGQESPHHLGDLKYKDPPRHSFDGRDRSTTTLEDLRESIRRLAKLQETVADGCEAPTSSPKLDAVRSPFSDDALVFYETKDPPRSSSFDYKEAMRLYQKVKEAPRLSLDSRPSPKSVLEIRQAIQAHFDGLDIPSSLSRCNTPDMKRASRSFESASQSTSTSGENPLNTSSRRAPSVIARLMGLENLPDATPPAKPKSVQKKPSKEAKLLQELLHCKPFEESAQHKLATERKGSPQAQIIRKQPLSSPPVSQTRGSGKSQQTSGAEARLSGGVESKGKAGRPELQETSKQMQEPLSVTRPQQKTLEAVQPAIYKKQDSMPIGEEKTVEAPKPNQEVGVDGLQTTNFFQDEIEKKLRQLGLQSSEHERKTLKQILESMHLKGLFQDPQVNELKSEPDNSVARTEPLNGSSIDKPQLDFSPQIHTSKLDSCGKLDSHGSTTSRSHGSMVKTQANSLVAHTTQASIVIMKPLSKSPSISRTRPPSSSITRHEVASVFDPQSVLTNPSNFRNAESSGGIAGVNSRSDSSRAAPASPRHLADRKSKEGKIIVIPRKDPRINEVDTRNTQANELNKTKQKDANAMKERSQFPAQPPSQSAASGGKSNSHKHSIKEVRSLQSSMPSSDQNSLSTLRRNKERSGSDSSNGSPRSPAKIRIDANQCCVDAGKAPSPKLETAKETILRKAPSGNQSTGPEDSKARGDRAKSNDNLQAMREKAGKRKSELKAVGCNEGREQSLVNSKKRSMQIKATEVCTNGDEHDELLNHGGSRLQELEFCREKMGLRSADHDLKVSLINKTVVEMEAEEQTQSSPKSVLQSHSDMGECSPDSSTGELGAGSLIFQGRIKDEALQYGSGELKHGDLKYVEEILKSASMDGMVRRWYLHGDAVEKDGVYSRLEEKWEGMESRSEQKEEMEMMVDRDYGGELYRKSRQEAMRRRLVLDCVNEIVCKKICWAIFEEGKSLKKRRWRVGMEEVWEDLVKLVPCMPPPEKAKDDVDDDLVDRGDMKEWDQEDDDNIDDHWTLTRVGDRINAEISKELGEMIFIDLLNELAHA